MSSKLAKAIIRIAPDAEFIIRNNEIEWHSENNPSQAEIDNSLLVIEAEAYKEKRAEEYPAIAEQLDYIYHNGIEAWKADMILPVKNKYPKGSE